LLILGTAAGDDACDLVEQQIPTLTNVFENTPLSGNVVLNLTKPGSMAAPYFVAMFALSRCSNRSEFAGSDLM